MPQTPDRVPPIPDYARLLDGRVAVVTGGGAGIGEAIADLFTQHGATVEVAEIDPERAAGSRAAHATVVDVRDDEARAAWVAEVLARRGRVDVLVNNVGD